MISLMVAIAKNNVIGKDNKLPWHYKKDLQYFKEVTMNHTIVMGRKTFDSILSTNFSPLPNRKHVVVTRNNDFKYEGVEVVHDFNKYLNKKYEEEIFIIGGSQIFAESLPYADRLYITWIDKEYAGDTFFPKVDLDEYKLIDEKKDGVLTFSVYERS